MRKKPKIPTDLLKALNYSSAEEAALEMLLLSARSKGSEFRQEVERLEEKYGMEFETFQRQNEAQMNQEDFEHEEDLMAWKFAHEAAAYWRRRVEELEHAVRTGQAIV
jgi:hypothetical protein